MGWPARALAAGALDDDHPRLRLDHLRQPGPRRFGVRRRVGTAAVHVRPQHACDARDVLAAPAPERAEQPVPGLHRRRLLLPRQPRRGRHLDDDAPHLRDRRDARRDAGFRAAPRLRPEQGPDLERGDHLGAPGPERVAVDRDQDRRRRPDSEHAHRRDPLDEARRRRHRRDRELVCHRPARRRLHRDQPQAVPLHAPAATARRRSRGRSPIPTSASTRSARSTTAPGRRRW